MTTTSTAHRAPVITAPGLFTAAWIITGRTIGSWRSQFGVVVIVWLFPVFVTLLFLGLFGGALQVPEGTSYVDFLIPGMLAVTMLFGLETTTLTAAADAARGVNDRFRSFPINAASIVLGRCMADTISSLVSLATMATFGLLIGWGVAAAARTERIRRPTTWVRKGQPATSTLGGVGVPSSVWSCAAVSRSTRSAA